MPNQKGYQTISLNAFLSIKIVFASNFINTYSLWFDGQEISNGSDDGLALTMRQTIMWPMMACFTDAYSKMNIDQTWRSEAEPKRASDDIFKCIFANENCICLQYMCHSGSIN